MKTTLELGDDVLREAKAAAARGGISLCRYFEEALVEKLAREGLAATHPASGRSWPVEPPEVPCNEIRRIQALIDEEFEQIEPSDADDPNSA
jgi:hypothetical protein